MIANHISSCCQCMELHITQKIYVHIIMIGTVSITNIHVSTIFQCTNYYGRKLVHSFKLFPNWVARSFRQLFNWLAHSFKWLLNWLAHSFKWLLNWLAHSFKWLLNWLAHSFKWLLNWLLVTSDHCNQNIHLLNRVQLESNCHEILRQHYTAKGGWG